MGHYPYATIEYTSHADRECALAHNASSHVGDTPIVKQRVPYLYGVQWYYLSIEAGSGQSLPPKRDSVTYIRLLTCGWFGVLLIVRPRRKYVNEA